MPKKTARAKKAKVKHNFKKDFMYLCSCCAAIMVLLLTGLNINKFLDSKKVLGATIDTSGIENEKAYWLQVVSQNPTYRDGYLELAILDNTLGNKEESLMYFNKAKSIDPNSQKINEVKNLLEISE